MLTATRNIFYATKLSKLYFSVYSLAKLLKLGIHNLNPNPNPNKLTLFSSQKEVKIYSIEKNWKLNIYVIFLYKMSALYNKL